MKRSLSYGRIFSKTAGKTEKSDCEEMREAFWLTCSVVVDALTEYFPFLKQRNSSRLAAVINTGSFIRKSLLKPGSLPAKCDQLIFIVSFYLLTFAELILSRISLKYSKSSSLKSDEISIVSSVSSGNVVF